MTLRTLVIAMFVSFAAGAAFAETPFMAHVEQRLGQLIAHWLFLAS